MGAACATLKAEANKARRVRTESTADDPDAPDTSLIPAVVVGPPGPTVGECMFMTNTVGTTDTLIVRTVIDVMRDRLTALDCVFDPHTTRSRVGEDIEIVCGVLISTTSTIPNTQSDAPMNLADYCSRVLDTELRDGNFVRLIRAFEMSILPCERSSLNREVGVPIDFIPKDARVIDDNNIRIFRIQLTLVRVKEWQMR
jgi:hypothetical protein